MALGPEWTELIVDTTRNTVITLGAFGVYLDYERRPRGVLEIDPTALEVRPSQVVGGGLGVYATRDLGAGASARRGRGSCQRRRQWHCRFRYHRRRRCYL